MLICSLAEAQISDVDIVNSLKNEIDSESSKNAEEFLNIFEKYFNDGCKITINDEKIILKKDRFSQYANIVAAFFPKIKKGYKFEIPKSILNDDGKNNKKSDDKKSKLSAFLNISEKQRIKIDFVLENKKFSEVILKDVPLSRGQSLMLRGILNLLK